MEPTSLAAYVGSTNGLEEAGRFNNRMMRGFTSQGGTQRNIEAEAEAVLRHIEQGAEQRAGQRAGQDSAPGAGKAEGEDKLGPIQYSEDSRQTSAEDINWTVTIIANSIKLVSAVLTILAAESTDRLASTALQGTVAGLPRIMRQKSEMGAALKVHFIISGRGL